MGRRYPLDMGMGGRLNRRGDGYLLVSPLEIPGWEVRRFRRPAILVEGRRFEIAESRSFGKGAVEYDLRPWPADYHDEPTEEIVCDQGFLLALEAAGRARPAAEASYEIMRLLKPLIGFLPSGTKLRILERHGVHPAEATRLSLMVEYLALVVMGALLTIHTFTQVLPGRLLWTLVLVIAPDALVRYSRDLAGDFSPPGFYEWLFRRRRS